MTTVQDLAKYTFDDIEGDPADRLRAARTEPVPPAIISLAQKSWIGVEHNGKLVHVLRHQFKPGEEEKRDFFVKMLKKAGPHTEPRTSVAVLIDPDKTGDTLLVAWRATLPRGRKTS